MAESITYQICTRTSTVSHWRKTEYIHTVTVFYLYPGIKLLFSFLYCEWQSHSKERPLLKDKIRLFLRLFQLFCHGWRLPIQFPVWMQTSDKLDKKLLMKNKLIGTSVDTHLLMFTLEVKKNGKSIKPKTQMKSNFTMKNMKYNFILHHNSQTLLSFNVAFVFIIQGLRMTFWWMT